MKATGVSFLDLTRQHAVLKEDLERAVAGVLGSQKFILGPEVELLEKEIALACHVPHGVGVASGTDALMLALQALGVGPGDDVITSPFSFFASASAVARLGARPRFADIDAGTFNLDPAAIARSAGSRIRALVPVHLFGQCAEVESLKSAAEAAAGRNLAVVEDAAQAIGARRRGTPAGALGDAGCFSFYPTKNLGGAGDGGMIVTASDEVASRARRLRAHGDAGRYDHRELGMNSRLDSLQAAILRVKLKRLESWNEARRERAAAYDELLGGVAELKLPVTLSGNVHTFHQYVIRTKRRDELARHLSARGIGTAVYYPIPLHLQACFAYLGHKPGDYPAAEAACREVLALPLYPELTPSEQALVGQEIVKFFRGA